MSEPSDRTPDYSVGYGRPPTDSRFKPGQGGNPAGRRKGQPSAQELIMREVARLVKVKRGDEVETVTKHEVVLRQLGQMAMQGDLVAMRLLFSVINSDASAASEGTPVDETAKLSLPARPDDDAIRRMLARFQHLQSEAETP